jgi:hypothetical protein
MSTQTTLLARDVGQVLGRVLRGLVKRQTYRNLCYLMVMFPLGIVYFILLTVGVTTGAALVIIGIGIPIIVLVLAVVVGLARLERTLIRVLLGVAVPPPAVETEYGLWERSKRLVTGRRTWKAVAYLLSEFVYGTVVFALLAPLLATGGSFFFAPVYYQQAPVVAYGPFRLGDLTVGVLFGWNDLLVGLTMTFQLGSWQIETLPGALLVASLGIVLLLVAFQVANVLAWVWGRYARIMLTIPPYGSTPN